MLSEDRAQSDDPAPLIEVEPVAVRGELGIREVTRGNYVTRGN